jgi:pimeloyl-ACP methyl ester carboxylesterase
MPFISVARENSGSVDLYYEDQGSGKPVILIHGWPLNGRSWEKQVPTLLKAGYRVITYDRRGFGNSSKPASGYNYDTLTDDLHSLIMDLELYDVSLVGFSMGGGEVARYIAKYGSVRARKAAFIAAIPPYLLKTQDNPKGVEGKVFDDIKGALVADRFAFLSNFFANFYNVDVLGGKRISDQAVQSSWITGVQASPLASLDCVSAWLTDFRKDLAGIDVPTLIVHGDSDRIVPLESSGKRTHEIVRGSNMVVIDDAPHGLNWTHADKLNPELLAFLGKSQ